MSSYTATPCMTDKSKSLCSGSYAYPVISTEVPACHSGARNQLANPPGTGLVTCRRLYHASQMKVARMPHHPLLLCGIWI